MQMGSLVFLLLNIMLNPFFFFLHVGIIGNGIPILYFDFKMDVMPAILS